MPYARNSDLPAQAAALPSAAQTTFRHILNAALDQYDGDEEKAFATAWAGLKRAGWTKDRNGHWRHMKKAAEETALLEMPITKVDADRHLVFGWANVAVQKDGGRIEDLQGDVIDITDLEEAAYAFNLEFRTTGEMHAGDAVGQLVESFVVTAEKLEKMGLPTDVLPQGWWVGFYIPDETAFGKVKSGEYTMFSIQGLGTREEL